MYFKFRKSEIHYITDFLIICRICAISGLNLFVIWRLKTSAIPQMSNTYFSAYIAPIQINA